MDKRKQMQIAWILIETTGIGPKQRLTYNQTPGLTGKLIYVHDPAYVAILITPPATLESLHLNIWR